ncbi:MAG TPA: tetratricopeptide repeat protein [Blastocatellia bacterium]|nr:tetratricopeptide repeat protein [Blastocatellia bacterium]
MPKRRRQSKAMTAPEGSARGSASLVETTQTVAKESPRTKSSATPTWRGIYVLAPVVLACLAFLNTLSNGFATDDLYQILNNPFIKDLANLPKAFTTSVWAFVSGEIVFSVDSYFRPIFSVLFSIEHALFGTRAWGWHLTNILIHAAVTYLVFVVIREFTDQRWLALATAALFAVHPAHVESVAWISGITDPLMALFLLPAFFCYLRYRKEGRKLFFATGLGLYFLALLSKETAMALPLLVLYCELFYFNEQRPFSKKLVPALALAGCYALPTMCYFLMRYNAINSLFFGGEPRYPLDYALATVPIAVLKYLGLMTIPAGYSYQHEIPLVESFSDIRFLAPLTLLAVAAALVVLSRDRRLWFAAFCFMATLAPALAGLRLFEQEYLVQERYLYLPSFGFCLAAAVGIEWLASRGWAASRARLLATALTCVLVLVWGVVCVRQNGVWKDSLTVYRNCVTRTPRSALAHAALSRAFFEAGRPVEAEEAALAGLSLDPACANCHINLSYYQHRAGKKDKAIEHLEQGVQAIKEGPLSRQILATMYLNLGLIYAEIRDYAQAEKNLLKSTEVLPRAVGWYHTGNFYLDRGRYEEAGQMFELTRRKTPDWFAVIHVKLGQVYDLSGQKDRAREEYKRYLELAPENAPDRANVTKRLAQL